LSLFQAVVVPSGFSTTVQPLRWISTWWWCVQNRAQSLTEVLPPSALRVRWWTSHPAAQVACKAAGAGEQGDGLADDLLLDDALDADGIRVG